ncbi:hypothetical protein ACJ73_10052, partial [Blastomyces percursus]
AQPRQTSGPAGKPQDRSSQKADRSSPQKIIPPLSDSDHDPALDESAGVSDRPPYSLAKLPRSVGCRQGS